MPSKFSFINLFNNKKIKFLIYFLIITCSINKIKADNKKEKVIFNNLDNSDKQISIKNEFNNFLKKYNSNSCVMSIFSKFREQCEEIDDRQNSILSYQMTLCIYSSLSKKLNFQCNVENNLECIKFLEGDLWTTYITFTHHIDNLCFYYKTLLWEKSSEFIFFKLMNSSMNVLNELSASHNMAEKLINSQEKFSVQIEENLDETLKNFKNINQFFENYTKIEEQLKNNIQILESKINSNNEKMKDAIKYIDDKLHLMQSFYEFFNTYNNSNSLFYFLSLFLFIWLISFFESMKGIRIFLNLLGISFFLFEKFILTNLCDGRLYYDFCYIYYNLIFYLFRIIYFFIIILILLYKCYNHKVDDINSNRKMKSDYKYLIDLTPMWMRKYFSKIKRQNEYLIDKFHKMKELMEKESLYLKEKSTDYEDGNSISYYRK